jgi:phosphoglycolate phosphatase
MKTEAVIFDLDGTLLDTLDDLCDSANFVLEQNGYPTHDREKYSYFVGNGARKLIERALPENQRGKESVEIYLGQWRRAYKSRWNNKTKPYDGINDMLLKLRELRIPMAVLSNKTHNEVLKIMDFYFDDSLFFSIDGQQDHIPHKPAPDGVYTICEKLGVKPENCLFVGDTSVDMETAKISGMKAVGVSWGFRPVEELLENGADYIINHPSELLPLI